MKSCWDESTNRAVGEKPMMVLVLFPRREKRFQNDT
jgi:hypothetical protein